MATGQIERKGPSTSSRPGGQARKKIGSNFANLDLPSFISQMLGQYQNLLVHQVERDVKDQALAAVKQEALALQYQAAERLHAMESQVQKSVQAVLDLAQERIFEMMRKEMEDIFGELDTRLTSLLDDTTLDGGGPQSEAEKDEHEDFVKSLVAEVSESEEPATFDWEIEAKDEGEQPEHAQATLPPEVRIELPPPLDVRHLLGFYRGLSEAKDVRILRSRGSLEQGVSFFIRPTQIEAVTQILKALPGVSDIQGAAGPGDGADTTGGQTFKIVLTEAA